MIGGSVSKIGIQTTKDITPFILNSGNAVTDTVNDIYENPFFKIEGISQNIKIKISFNDSTGDQVFYSVSDEVGALSSTIANQLSLEVQPDNIINIISGKYLVIGIFNATTSEDREIILLNNSSGDAVLTTITGNVTR
jgi:hypothetical protein